MSALTEEREQPVEQEYENDVAALDNGDDDPDIIGGLEGRMIEEERGRRKSSGSHISGILEEEMEAVSGLPQENGRLGKAYKEARQQQSNPDHVSSGQNPSRSQSPVESFASLPDDTPSIQGSVLSSPGSSVLPSRAARPGVGSPTPSFRPFDRRFSSRLAFSPAGSRASSPAFLKSHSRNTSLASQIVLDNDDTDTPSPPWEIVRWTKLKKLNGQAFSEAGRRNFGTPTCISVSQNIVVGTSKGIILIFDYNQSLKSIIGLGTKAVESGAITSIAVSADYNTVAGGHANGSIFTWDTTRSAKPFLHIPALEGTQLQNRTVDGHIPNASITHVGFLGTRHTALVSANDRGMAFSHLASRGTGLIGRSIKTTRILGRYADDQSNPGKPRKPSTVLAFAPLPLGNVERQVDSLGLTAMLTPYLLVIVSTTPVAQTQHKASRPKEVAAHSAMSACLAWFPAVKLKVKDPASNQPISRVKLVYCWSNVLTVLEIEEVESVDKDKPPSLLFKARSRWQSEEAIVAVQWLSRSVLSVLTITQRLIILEDNTMRMTEGFDLIGKHIFHQDLFSNQLHSLVEQLNEDDTSMHGVVADAFYMSFKAYKGKMFILGFNDVSVGALSNWADRLIALMEHGDYIGAITLANTYYTGNTDKLTIGLPEDKTLRHSMVHDKLIEIMTASLRYAFGRDRIRGAEGPRHLRDLAEACFTACLSINGIDYLFDDVYEWFEEGDERGIFLETLEPYVLTQEVSMIPPVIVKSMVTYFVTAGLESRLEDMLCQMDTATLDLDELTTLCKQHNLYDALIYVWNDALGDYITPLIDLLSILRSLAKGGDYFANGNISEGTMYEVNALKMFPYFSYTFTGRRYPTGDALDEQDATNAKAELYWFLFSGKTISWPKGSQKQFLTMPDGEDEPSFPYLRMILKFDAPSFLSALNEAFEDSFLNDSPDRAMNGGSDRGTSEERVFGTSMTRQYVVSILLEVMTALDFTTEDTIYLDMFIARNLPKFPQYLLLSGTALHNVLIGLCNYPGEDLAADAQLSAEYLLSVYHPSDLSSLMPRFEQAGFYRVLKSIYRTEQQFAKLIETFFEDDNDREEVFDCIADVLGRRKSTTKKQVTEIHDMLQINALRLVDLDPLRTARTIDNYAPVLHQHFLDVLEGEPDHEYIYLQAILEHGDDSQGGQVTRTREKSFIERYVQLMCKYNPAHVVDFVNSIQASDLRLDKVLPFMEDFGVIDAAVVLMAREGQLHNAMDRLVKHLGTIEAALLGLLSSDDGAEILVTEQAAEDLLFGLQRYTSVGIWLCKGQDRTFRRSSGFDQKKTLMKEALPPDELLWLDLIDSTVQITKTISAALNDFNIPTESQPNVADSGQFDKDKLLTVVRSLVQRTFTALLSASSTPTQTTQPVAFLRVLRAFLTRASLTSPNLSDLRAVLSSIFSAYTYEKNILALANVLLEKDLYVNVKDANELRQRGWRPRGSLCEGCKKRVWGAGTGGNIFIRWEEKERQNAEKSEQKRRALLAESEGDRGKGISTANHDLEEMETSTSGHGKGKAPASMNEEGDNDVETQKDGDKDKQEDLGPVVVLACRHIYHKTCLERVQPVISNVDGECDYREFRCPIDG